MYPLIHIGNVYIEAYWLTFTITILIGILLLFKEAKRKGFPIRKLAWFLLMAIPLSFIISHIYYWLFFNPQVIFKRPVYMLLFWKGGLAAHGGIGAGILLSFIFCRLNRINFWKFADILGLVFALGESIQRIGCFLNGCCYGVETDLIWAVMFTHPSSLAPKGIYLHPTQLYLCFGTLLIFVFLWMKRKKIKYDGQIFLNYLILQSILRSLVENFRADALYFFGTSLRTAQVVGITLILLALILKSYLKKKPQD